MQYHSRVDVITNSSTSVFCMADNGSVNAVRNMVDEILKIAGSDLSCDDLFEISLDASEHKGDYDEWVVDQIEEHEGSLTESVQADYDNYKRILDANNNKPWGTRDYLEVEEARDKLVSNPEITLYTNGTTLLDFCQDYNADGCNDYKYSINISIKAKDCAHCDAANALNMVNSLFDYEASYC